MTDQQIQEFIIPQPLAQATINYLQSRPYAEVYQLIAALVELQPVQRVSEAVAEMQSVPIGTQEPASPSPKPHKVHATNRAMNKNGQ